LGGVKRQKFGQPAPTIYPRVIAPHDQAGYVTSMFEKCVGNARTQLGKPDLYHV